MVSSEKSLPSWERGLKYLQMVLNNAAGKVAPLVGAWIEIDNLWPSCIAMVVAPLVGAWIEIDNEYSALNCAIVAPLVGAWIEIYVLRCFPPHFIGRSPRGSVD